MKLLKIVVAFIATYAFSVVAETGKQVPTIVANSGIELLLPADHPNALNKKEIEGITQGQWYSLYQPKGQVSWQYKKTKVSAKIEHNECWGNSLNISSRYDSEYSILIKGLSRLEGSVSSIKIPLHQNVFWPGESFDFSINNQKYTLSVKGAVEEQQPIRNENNELVASGDVTNYQVYLFDESGKKQLLIERPHLNLDTIVRLRFVGDLDADNKPDFVFDVNMSNDYERTETVLFLSSHAKQDEFVEAVALAVHDFAC